MSDKLIIMANLPKLAPPAQFEITSPRTPRYNCIAWAAGETNRRWWPDKMKVDYWPRHVPREVTLTAFVAAYQTLGFDVCDNADLEEHFEKIAIFSSFSGRPTHAARQLRNGKWTSKLGDEHDIEHDLRGVEGRDYGEVKLFMRRPLQP